MFSAQETLKLDAREPLVRRPAGSAAAADEWQMEVFSSPHSIKSEWQLLEHQSSLPFTSFAWSEAWFETVAKARDQQPVILLGRAPDGRPSFLLPFVKEKRGPFSVLLWPGGTHCAYQCGLFAPSCRAWIKTHGADAFWKQVFAALPHADAIAAYGLPGLDAERDNPLGALPSVDSSCVSYRFDLQPSWPALYESKCSARLRSDDRRCERRFNEMGFVRFLTGDSAEDRLRLVDTLLEQKSVQLCASGAPDFTAGAGVRAFYRRLVTSPYWAETSTPFMACLEVDDKPAAVNLGIVDDGTFHGLVLSMGEGETARFGPGRQLLKRTIEHFCGLGLSTFDLGAGEEANKLKWCDQSVSRRDVLVPLTPRGRVFVLGMRGFFATKTAIKQSPVLWRLFSRFRRYLGC